MKNKLKCLNRSHVRYQQYKLFLPTFIFAILAAALLDMPVFAESTAKDIIRKVENKQRGKTSAGRFEITIERARFKRTMLLDNWDDRLKKKFFMRIIKPKKDKGITFLKSGGNFWQFIPKVGKEIKVEGSLMQDSWMGSDFSNDDLVKESSVITDYTHSLLKLADSTLWQIEMIPKPNAPVVWSRVVAKIRKNDLMPVSYEFYDHKNRLSKKQAFYDYKVMGGRKIPSRMVMSTIKKGKVKSRTTLRFVRIKFDRPISNRIFSRANLRR